MKERAVMAKRKKSKRKISGWQRHVRTILRAGGTIKQAARSWKGKGTKRKGKHSGRGRARSSGRKTAARRGKRNFKNLRTLKTFCSQAARELRKGGRKSKKRRSRFYGPKAPSRKELERRRVAAAYWSTVPGGGAHAHHTPGTSEFWSGDATKRRGTKGAWKKFVKKHRRRGLSMKQIGRLWRKKTASSHTTRRSSTRGKHKSKRGFKKSHAKKGYAKKRTKKGRKLSGWQKHVRSTLRKGGTIKQAARTWKKRKHGHGRRPR